MSRAGSVWIYYALTPVFAAIDFGLGASIRAAGIESPGWRVAYYVLALSCGALMRFKPRWTPFLGIGESSVNIFLLILSILGPIFALPAAVAEGADIAYTFGPEQLVNLLLSGTVLVLSFHRHQAAIVNLVSPKHRR